MKNLILIVAFSLTVNFLNAQVKTELLNYKGWQNSIQLTNNEIKIIVVPQIGRIIHFSYLGEENLLYENTEFEGKVYSAQKPYKVNGELAHVGFGGDRIWPTVQDNFVFLNGSRGLPDPWIDGSPWNYKLVKNGVEITSPTSHYLGAKVTRTITLEKNGATVNILQKMEKVKLGNKNELEPIPVTLWNLSKIKNPRFGILPLSKTSHFKNSIEFQKWPDNINSALKNYSGHGSVGQLIPVPGLFQKMGTDSKGWVAGVYEDLVFGQFFKFDKNESYPDGGTSATIFTCTNFTEMECLSPEKKLKVGETLHFNIQWKLKNIKAKSEESRREQATKWLDKELRNLNSIKVKINPDVTFQTIHNFGASDAWSCQYVGNWPSKQRNQIADLLFSLEEKPDGSPKGIGLSCWRFNIGSGSADQKSETKIGDPWRKTECFLKEDQTYNWNKQRGQRWFLHAAKERGVKDFIGFVNSPPVWLTINGRANSDGGNSTNLKKENFKTYSKFLVDVIKNIEKNDGILFNYISPINEPQWDWKGGQEGSPWKNSEIATFCKMLGNDISNANLSTKISIAEAGFLTHLFDRGNDSERGFQIKSFFSPVSEYYIGDVPNMAHKISGHSYHTVKSDSIMNVVRSKLFEELQRVDPSLEFWMSEYCILGGNGILKGRGRDLGMETALFVANIMHSDLTVANSSVWHWWLAVSPYNFKDGLVYIDKNESGGNIYESKLLWAMGNYSRFIRPGAKRVQVNTTENPNLKISAYKNTNAELVVVCLNKGQNKLGVSLNISGIAQCYETSESNNLKRLNRVNLKKPVVLPQESITTFVIQ